MALNENVKLKREIDSLGNALEVLTAELNSVKIITQYHSDSESELSHSLTPLKVSRLSLRTLEFYRSNTNPNFLVHRLN